MKRLWRLTRHPLFWGSSLLMAGNVLASLGNYLFHLLSGRLLLPAEYGVLESFFALVYILGVLTGAISLATTKIIGELEEEKVSGGITFLEKKIEKNSFLAVVALFLLVLFLRPFLHIYSLWFYLALLVFFLLSLWGAIYNGVFSARLRFDLVAGLGVLQSFLKLILAAAFLYLGWHLAGALGSIILAAAIGLLLANRFSHRLWSSKNKRLEITDFWHFSLLALGLNFFLTALYSNDVLLVKHFFSPHWVGLYSAAAVSGRAIFFAASMVLGVTYPLLVRYQKKPRRRQLIFALTFWLMLAMAVGGAITLALLPRLWLGLLYGHRYLAAAPFLPLLALVMGELALLNLFMQLALANKDRRGLIFMGLAFGLQLGLIFLWHPSLQAVVWDSFLAVTSGLLLALAFYWRYPILIRKLSSGS